MKALLAVMLSAVAFLAIAQGTPGYVTDGSGQIVKTGSGLCLHTGTYTAADAVKGCDPVKEVERKPVTINGDVLFEFDSSALTTAGQAALDRLLPTIVPGSTVTVVGHTDRIGTAQYNLKLSQHRAGAVADYLNAKSGFKSKFVTQGVGATQPTEGTKLCTGMKNFERFKSCLAPDRRVVITVIK
jgi:OmpA-OmpF porin, OOP family